MSRLPSVRPLQYRLDLYDERSHKGDPMFAEALDHHGNHAQPSLVPRGMELDLGEDRVRVSFHFPADLRRFELDEVFRWIGSLSATEVDRIFEGWETGRLHAVGVPFVPLPGTASSYSLDDLALCGPPATKEPPARPATKPEAPKPPRKRPAPSPLPTRRPRTLAGKRINYEIVCLEDHAELRFRRGWGRGEVRHVAKIDLEDAPLVSQYAWHLSGNERAGWRIETDTGSASGSRIRHQLQRVLVPTAGGAKVSHVNGDGSDYRKANLTAGTGARKAYRSNTSGFRGVSLNKNSGKYEATMGKRRLGYFATAEEAGAVARSAREAAGWVDAQDPAVRP